MTKDQQPVKENIVCSDSNQTAQPLQMAVSQSLYILFGMILNSVQPKFAAKTVANEM